jgi:hypothetical protein
MAEYQQVHLNFLMAKRSLETFWFPHIKNDEKIMQQLNIIDQTSIDIMKSQIYYFSSIQGQMKSLMTLITENINKNDKMKRETSAQSSIQTKVSLKTTKSVPLKLNIKFTQFQDLTNQLPKEELKLNDDYCHNEVNATNSHTPKIFYKIESSEENEKNDKDPLKIKHLIDKRPNDLKFRSDCFRKRIKTHYHNYIYKHLTNLINDKNKIIYRLPKEFNTNIRYDFNNMIFKFTIKDLFTYKPLDEYDQINTQKTSEIINSLTSPQAIYFLNRTYLDVFIEYIYSSNIREELKVIIKNDGLEYIKYFKYFLENYISFYSSEINRGVK